MADYYCAIFILFGQVSRASKLLISIAKFYELRNSICLRMCQNHFYIAIFAPVKIAEYIAASI